MAILPESAYKIKIPKMLPVKQIFPDEHVKEPDIQAIVRKEIFTQRIQERVKPGQSIAVTVGSRGIACIDTIVKATIDCLKELGTDPFIIPAMGSHGGGVAEEQRKIIEGYGITEERMGVPIKVTMETVVIGETPGGIPVHMDKYAYEADAVVEVCRVKTHTDFKGPIESGLCKMLAIGCGKHNGCSTLHREGFDSFAKLIPEVAQVFIENKNIAFGIAIIENAHDHVHTIRAVPGDRYLEEEPELLKLSKSLMPRLRFESIDVLIVEEIGKDITGAGMDPNIMGRLSYGPPEGYQGPKIQRIVVLGLTKGTHGNAVGIGVADYTTSAVRDAIDYEASYANAIASCDPVSSFLPIALDTEEDAIRAAIQTCLHVDKDKAKIVRIKNTLDLVNIMVSENLRDYCKETEGFEI